MGWRRRYSGVLDSLRLRKGAERWFFSLPLSYRQNISTDWRTLKGAIGSFYMNRAWLDKQKARASNASFRETGYSSETPSEYYIRKSELNIGPPYSTSNGTRPPSSFRQRFAITNPPCPIRHSPQRLQTLNDVFALWSRNSAAKREDLVRRNRSKGILERT